MSDAKIHVSDALAQALCDTTPRHLYKRAMRAERRAEAAEERERAKDEALRQIRVRPPSEAYEIARAALAQQPADQPSRATSTWASAEDFDHVAADQPAQHELYKTGDPDAPDVILDDNGEVALGLCRRCGRGEIELLEPCDPPAQGGGSDL